MSSRQKKILISIDVEDYFQVENLRSWYPPQVWNSQKLRVEKNTYRLLDLLDRTGKTLACDKPAPKATFFILGWIAKKKYLSLS